MPGKAAMVPVAGAFYWLLNDGVRHSVDHRERLTALNVDEVSSWIYSNTSRPSGDWNGRGNNVCRTVDYRHGIVEAIRDVNRICQRVLGDTARSRSNRNR
jgi:hypothetical protein